MKADRSAAHESSPMHPDSVSSTVVTYLEGLPLGPLGRVHAATASVLARELDDPEVPAYVKAGLATALHPALAEIRPDEPGAAQSASVTDLLKVVR
jgi:hypothetical protein